MVLLVCLCVCLLWEYQISLPPPDRSHVHLSRQVHIKVCGASVQLELAFCVTFWHHYNHYISKGEIEAYIK